MMSLLPSALAALKAGWTIFPVEPGEKTPHRIEPDKPYTVRWSEIATTDINKVIEWWTYSPWANVGVAARPSGLLVVDCDIAKIPMALKDTPWAYLHDRLGMYLDGEDLLRELCSRYQGDWEQMRGTYRVCTASMGAHYYFRWPAGVVASQASIAKGVLDVRCNGGERGGYVLGAGSITSKGSYVAENDLPVAAAPGWLVELVRDKPHLRPARSGFRRPTSPSYGGLAEAVRFAYEGNRNNCLLWAARSMCADGAGVEEAYELLVPAALECGLDGGERQARSTIRSAYRLQERKDS